MCFMVNGKKGYIIDKSIIKIIDKNEYCHNRKLVSFMNMLIRAGADYLEINKKFLERMSGVIPAFNFIYRIEEGEDIELCLKNNFSYGIITLDKLLKLHKAIRKNGKALNLMLEIDIKDIKEIGENKYIDECEYILDLKRIIDINLIKSIRLTNVNKEILLNWKGIIRQLRSELKIKVDVCPNNDFHMATAIAVEASINGCDFITASFAGKGNINGYAALEEIIMALKVINKIYVRSDISLFSCMREEYISLTGENISKVKPILGLNIFKYESGVHADGIEKNPSTYEPYNPNSVGLKRELILGKHSGSKSIMTKLKELKLEFSNEDVQKILNEVKVKSVHLKRGIKDEELIQIHRSVSAS